MLEGFAMRLAPVVVIVVALSACGSSSITSGTSSADAPISLADGPAGGGGDAPNQSTSCVGPLAPCGGGDTCCTGTCEAGVCNVAGCMANGGICGGNGDCCSSTCTAGTCAPLPGAGCVTIGNTCALDGDCCSNTCSADGHCVNAGGPIGCQATGDLCFTGDVCCTNVCSGATATAPGTCAAIHTTGSGGCMLDGEPCTSGTNCCSRVCAAAPGGGTVCQLADGCRIAGDLCRRDTDCCGGAGTSGLGAGEVSCNFIDGIDPPLGTCSNPHGNDPEGDVCGLGTNAREDCFGCMPPKVQCCREDSLGVARCYGGSTDQCPAGYTGMPPCCIAAGGACTFSSECCGGAPCVPDSTGKLVCGTSCVPEEGVCTATGDCCTGLVCDVPVGAPAGVCKNPAPSDGGVCALGGQSCGDAQACCTGYVCFESSGAAPCMHGETGCTCFRIIN